MLTRIEVSDLFLENARSTAEVEINPPAPLKKLGAFIKNRRF